jgi:hypothetical protein
MPNPHRSIPAAVTLFFLAPLVAEFLLGDFPVTWLPLLLVLAPMYGGGALLIREAVRRTGRGWPSILLLGCAYCLMEEGFTTQSLFNPNYLGLHLLRPAWIPSLGISAWWTLFMLNVHPFWSIGVSIALAEGLFPSSGGLFPSRAHAPWLGKVGISIAGLLFVAGGIVTGVDSYRHDHFRASNAQLAVTALFCVLFAVAAFLIPAPAPRATAGAAPSPWLTGAGTFLLGAAVFLAPVNLNWVAVGRIFAVDLVFLLSLRALSRRSGWTPLHTFSIGAGGALVYGVHAFLQGPVVPSPRGVVLASHVLFLALALAVVAVAAWRTRSALRPVSSEQIAAEPA